MKRPSIEHSVCSSFWEWILGRTCDFEIDDHSIHVAFIDHEGSSESIPLKRSFHRCLEVHPRPQRPEVNGDCPEMHVEQVCMPPKWNKDTRASLSKTRQKRTSNKRPKAIAGSTSLSSGRFESSKKFAGKDAWPIFLSAPTGFECEW